jgi:hypothetical protein
MKQQRTITTLPPAITHVSGFESIDSDKIDAAVWELMADYRKRNIFAIIDVLVMKGFNRKNVDARIRVLRAKKWFDRNGERGNTVQYILKKHVKHPQAKETIVMEAKKSGIEISPISLSPRNEFELAEQHEQIKQLLSDGVADPTAPGPQAKPVYVVEKTDHPQVAIWKILQDGSSHTTSELALLIDHVAKYKVVNAITVLAKTILVSTRVKGERENRYSLKPGSPMPDVKAPRPYNRKAKATPAAEAQPEAQPKEETMNIPPNIAAPQTPVIQTNAAGAALPVHANSTNVPAATAPLFEMSIKVMGQDMTMTQVRALRDYMNLINFNTLIAAEAKAKEAGLEVTLGLVIVPNLGWVKLEDALKLYEEIVSI